MNDTLSKTQCPHCQTPVQSDLVQGLCPSCLLTAAMSPGATELDSAELPEGLAELFEDYEIIEKVGQGGMGSVYQARHKDLNRLEALKILPADLAQDPSFEERFKREARTLAALNHNHIVTLYSSGRRGPKAYLAMELVDGCNLRALMNQEGWSAKDFQELLKQVIEALNFAHEKGIIHRDLKPENILIGADGQVKLADFGLARLVDDSQSLSPSLTGSHQVLGTPSYMAPEQLEGREQLDKTVDYFALAVLCYEVLTGKRPKGRFKNPTEIARKGFKRLSRRLEPFILKALEMEPEDRPQSLDLGLTAKPSRAPGKAQPEASLMASETAELRYPQWMTVVTLCTGLLVLLASFSPWTQKTVSALPRTSIPGMRFSSMDTVTQFTATNTTLNVFGLRIPGLAIPILAAAWALMAGLRLFRKDLRKLAIEPSLAAAVTALMMFLWWLINANPDSPLLVPVPLTFLAALLTASLGFGFLLFSPKREGGSLASQLKDRWGPKKRSPKSKFMKRKQRSRRGI